MDPKHITRTSFCEKQIDNVTDNSMKNTFDNMFVKTGIRYNLMIMQRYTTINIRIILIIHILYVLKVAGHLIYFSVQ